MQSSDHNRYERGCEVISETYTQKKLKELMNEKGVTCYRVAHDTGISEQAVYAWANGTYEPKTKGLKKLADYFGVPITFFIE